MHELVLYIVFSLLIKPRWQKISQGDNLTSKN